MFIFAITIHPKLNIKTITKLQQTTTTTKRTKTNTGIVDES